MSTQHDELAALQSRVERVEAQSRVIERLFARLSELEPQAAQADRLREIVVRLTAVGVRPDGVDDFKAIEGIGPRIEQLCREAGIMTWRDMAETPVAELQRMLDAAGPRFAMHRPATWPAQAAALAAGADSGAVPIAS